MTMTPTIAPVTFRRATRPRPVLRTIAAHAATTPDLIAVDDGGYHSTYAEVWHAAARTRRDLTEAGVEPGDVVGIDAPAGAELVAAVLGVWLAGAAYLPIEPFHRNTAKAFLVGAGIRPPAGAPAVRMVEVVAAPTEPPYAPVPPGDAIACLVHVPATTARSTTIRLSHDDLATLITRTNENPRRSAGLPILELFRPLVSGDRLRCGPSRPPE
jgi:non-ribosomal peptide synthetase component F